MTYKERLNAILRLRLFFSTEKELADLIDYKSLHSNHFNKFDRFRSEAYFNHFAKECELFTQGTVNLKKLLRQYEATSVFYKMWCDSNVSELVVDALLDYVFLGKSSGEKRAKHLMLCERYDKASKDGDMNIGILLLLVHGLIPTFTNKAAQDVKDIIGDFEKAYDMLSRIAQKHKHGSTTVYGEMVCLKEMRQLTKEERKGDKYLNRLLLIFVTNDTLSHIFAFKAPERLKLYVDNYVPMDFELARFWRDAGDAENIFWEFEAIEPFGYHLYRREIDMRNNVMRFTCYQVMFRNLGFDDFNECSYTVIMRPIFIYNNILHREQPADACTYDYTEFDYAADGRTVTEMRFTKESPLGEKPLTLRPVTRGDMLKYYGQKREQMQHVNDCQEYAVSLVKIDVAVTNDAILFNFIDSVYKLDKYDKDGNETIPGISTLTHKDNYLYAILNDNGTERYFLSLDFIDQNLDLDDLQRQPYFKKTRSVKQIFRNAQ